MKRIVALAALAASFVAGYAARDLAPAAPVVQAQGAGKVFEMRTYVVPADRFAALDTRFRDHTLRMFQKHGMTNVAYFRPQDPAKATTTLVYLLSHASRQAADASWAAFGKDPEWQKIAADSGVGRVEITREFLQPTDYSPMK